MKRIIIDSDPGIDDFAAILFAVKSKMFDMLGVTTVAGNCSLEYATRNALKTLEIAGANNIPVYAGMSKALNPKDGDATHVHGNNGFGGVEFEDSTRKVEETSAIDFLINSVNSNPKNITIIAIGPLTNIATAIKRDSNFVKNIDELVIMGGAENTGNITPTAEFNFYQDPDAVKIVLESGIENITIIDLDVTQKVTLNPKLEEFLISKNDMLAKFWYDITRIGAKFDIEHAGVDGSIINDAVTIGYLLNSDLLKMKKVNMDISLDEKDYGTCIIKDCTDNSVVPNCKISYDVKADDFRKLLFKTIFPESSEEIDKIFE